MTEKSTGTRKKVEVTPITAEEALKDAGIEKDSNKVIFVGSGVVWGGKLAGNSALAEFDKYRLLKTDDPKLIKYMRENDFPEITYEALAAYIDSGTYFESISNLIKKQLPKNKHSNAFSEMEIKEILD